MPSIPFIFYLIALNHRNEKHNWYPDNSLQAQANKVVLCSLLINNPYTQQNPCDSTSVLAFRKIIYSQYMHYLSMDQSWLHIISSNLWYKIQFNKQLMLISCSWSITCQRCSNKIFILNLTPGFNILCKDNCKMRWETFKFGDLVSYIRILTVVWRIMHTICTSLFCVVL